jgi:tRNA(fMet)-specific endonuclease VapC
MFVLDTDILTLLFVGNPRVLSRRDHVPSTEIAITVVTYIQSLMGRFQFILKAATGEELLRAQLLLDGTVRGLDRVETVLPVDDLAAVEFDRLRQNKRLKKIGRGDILIAAITLASQATLVTRNVRDFRQVPGLQVENWAD